MRRWWLTAVLLALAGSLLAGVASSLGSSQSAAVTVSTTVLSATNLDVVSGCQTGTAGITDFGLVPPASKLVTDGDCTVTFGSSNGTSMLRLYQSDGLGTAMYRPAPGPIDPDWGGDGDVITNILNGDYGYAATLQPDGRLIVVGECWTGAKFNFCAARYMPDGTQDASFSGGEVNYPVLAGDDQAVAVAVQPDGKILIAGDTDGASDRDFAVMRLTSTGALDGTFGSGGTAVIPVGENQDYARGVAVQPDGRIVVAGWACCGGGGNDFAVVRLTSSGVLDTTFNGTGIRMQSLGTTDFAYGLALQPDGNIVVAGSSDSGGGENFAVARFTPGGGLDLGFAGTGMVVQSLDAGNDAATGVAIAPGGEIVVGGYTPSAMAVMRLTSAGVLDNTLNGTGMVVHDLTGGTDEANDIEVLGDDRMVLGGHVNGGVDRDVAMLRLNPDGSLDESLDGTGWVSHDFGTTNDRGSALTIGHDGTAYVAGHNDWTDFAIARWEGAPLPDFASGIVDWTSVAPNDAFFGACLQDYDIGTTVPTWGDDPDTCTSVNTDPWSAIAATAGGGTAKVAESLATGETAGSVDLHFGLRTGASQEAGRYLAPLMFEAVAPNI